MNGRPGGGVGGVRVVVFFLFLVCFFFVFLAFDGLNEKNIKLDTSRL